MRKHPASLLVALLCPTALALTGLMAPLRGDDYALHARLSGLDVYDGTPFDLFRFVRGHTDRTQGLVANGWFPWWTHPDLKLSLFRPLTSALMTLEHRIFGVAGPGYHVASLLGYLLLVYAVKCFYDRLTLPGIASAWAIVAFAIDDGHWESATWFANQHACLAGALGLFAATLQMSSPKKRWGAAALLSGALLFGETAVQVAALMIAFDLTEQTSWRSRAARLLPVVTVLSTYVALRSWLGYGARHTMVYADLLASPVKYLQTAADHLSVLLSELLLGVPSGWRTGKEAILAILGLSLPALLVYVFPLLKNDERRLLGRLAFGTMLAVPPVLSAPPSGRLLLIPGVGFFAIVGVVLDRAFREARALPHVATVRALAGGTVLLHYVVAPIVFVVFLTSHGDRQVSRIVHAIEVPSDCTDQNDVMLVRGIPSLMGLGPWQAGVRLANGHAVESPWVVLATTDAPLRLDWIDDSTFNLQSSGYPLIGVGADGVFTDDFGLATVGQRVQQHGNTITVTRTRDGYPTALRVRTRPSTCLVSFSSRNGQARVMRHGQSSAP